MDKSMEIALGKLSPTDNDVIVVKFNQNRYTVNNIAQFLRVIKDVSPCPVVAIPDDVELQLGDIDEMINYLQSMKKS